MSQQALYRTLRPKTFDGVVGQEHITDVLKKQVEKAAPSHAYLFYGPRGSGKTSSSRILANALNCLNPKDGNPCGECEVCKACASDTFVDIIEMDAASNSSVEDVREMLEKVPLLPASGKYKVYIIDEVHMFSKSAFNALLKTLEEPPAHTVFIFATTELSKVPKTIFSRTQKFGFKRLTNDTIERYITDLLEKMKTAYEPEAVSRLAVFADGAMRDALSLLDQCLSDGDVTTRTVTKILGIPSEEMTNRLCAAIMEEKISEAVKITNELLNEGISSSEILTDCSSRFTELLIEQADNSEQREKILGAIWALNEAQGLVKYTNVQSAVTIASIVRAAQSYASPPDKNLYAEVRRLKSDLEKVKENVKNAPSESADYFMPSRENDELAPKVEKLESRLTKAAEIYNRLNREYQNLKATTEELKERLNGGNAPSESYTQTRETSDFNDYDGADLKLNAIDTEEASSILYPGPYEQLKGMIELAASENRTLMPGLNVIKRLEVKEGKVFMFVKKDEMGMTQILTRDEMKPSMDKILNEIYGRIPEIEFVEFEEAETDNLDDTANFLKNEAGFETIEIVDGPMR